MEETQIIMALRIIPGVISGLLLLIFWQLRRTWHPEKKLDRKSTRLNSSH